ncbi:beta-1,4-N-acetylgalactosaminyltransferase bre-4-like isoform X1 [Dreissena polymorpha]|uniref:beta-1,4-N-acetylgalactosaminyltransferase bre-4-like isoform X1 n=1 Tax=Dreissena polymorpha TaxID=45954 RepID=UPI002264F923|nr:beta-1,4-N-acetylgalactosaminyltransferase bre-4-like isoform X1 [Dreissena polymorpha]
MRSVIKMIIVLVVLLVAFQYLLSALFLISRQFVDLSIMHTSLEHVMNAPMLGNITIRHATPETQELCPSIPPKLQGRISINMSVLSWASLEQTLTYLEIGGHFRPAGCVARTKVAIVVPYRNREVHLKIFLNTIHPFLQKQQLDYGMFVIEMAPNITFNRGLLMNIGYQEALRDYDYQCFIFHDVDLLPEDDRNLYSCEQSPRHMSVAIDKHNYTLPYEAYFGGVSAISRRHFQKINGFSNVFFGWGGEDDDMYLRIVYTGLDVTRNSATVARYKMLRHAEDKLNELNAVRFRLLNTARRRRLQDGIRNVKYTVLKKEYRQLYTWILTSPHTSGAMFSVNGREGLRMSQRKNKHF